MPAVEDALADAFQQEWGRVVAALIGATGDWDLAEECAQEAFALALPAWRRDGIPDVPRAWLITAARRRAVDRIRRERVGAAKLRELATIAPAESPVRDGFPDDRLRLIFTCCHPALAFEAQVTLALRTLCGLTVAEIARAFQVGEAAMAKRLVRTRQKITLANIPYRVPPPDRLAERTTAVLGVVYLLFNEGYAATAGDALIRPDLCAQAVRLAATVAELMPEDAEAGGLHALLLLQHARAAARVDASGALVPLEEQNRSTWDGGLIDAGLAALRAAVRHETLGPYQIQALIAACHATAPRAAATDWTRIADLYARLETLVPSWTVRLNRAIAIAMRDGPAAGLDRLPPAPADAAQRRLLAATRADLLRRLDRRDEARAEYATALAATDNAAERAYLNRRLVETTG